MFLFFKNRKRKFPRGKYEWLGLRFRALGNTFQVRCRGGGGRGLRLQRGGCHPKTMGQLGRVKPYFETYKNNERVRPFFDSDMCTLVKVPH